MYLSRKINNLVIASAISATALFSTACGKNPQNNIVRDVKVKTYHHQNGNSFAEIAATLDTGAIQFPSITLPIADPRNMGVVYGTLGLAPTLDGYTQLSVGVDLSVVAKLPGGVPHLPNGSRLPIAGVENVIELPVANTGSRVYLSLNTSGAMLGVAVAIREFDGIGGFLPGADLFLGFGDAAVGVRGVAGIFTGGVGQNGIGLFVDISEAVKKMQQQSSGVLRLGLESNTVTRSRAFAGNVDVLSQIDVRNIRKLQVVEQRPSDRKDRAIRENLYRMHVRSKRVSLR